MIEINLIPDIKRELIKSQQIRNKIIAISIIIGLVSMITIALLAVNVFAVQALRNNIADDSIKSKSLDLAKVEDLSKTLTIQNQLTKISDIYNSKKIDSRLFDMLVKIIPPAPNDVKLSSLSIDSDAGTISIDGQAANSFAAFEVFKKTIEGANIEYTNPSGDKLKVPLVADMLNIGSTSYGEDAASGVMVLRFSFSFKYSPELFAVTSKGLSITITSNGNVTDSYLGIPTSIFTVRASDITTGGAQ